jgi:hypothetical protein
MQSIDWPVFYRQTVSMAYHQKQCPIPNVGPADLVKSPLRLSDALRGRRFYYLPVCVAFDENGNMSNNVCYQFVVQRGTIKRHGSKVPMEGFRWFRLPAGANKESATAAALAELD